MISLDSTDTAANETTDTSQEYNVMSNVSNYYNRQPGYIERLIIHYISYTFFCLFSLNLLVDIKSLLVCAVKVVFNKDKVVPRPRKSHT